MSYWTRRHLEKLKVTAELVESISFLTRMSCCSLEVGQYANTVQHLTSLMPFIFR